MSDERIDHAAEARSYSDDASTNDGRVIVWGLQDIKESLDALVEQQRIANLIALNEARGPGDPWDFGLPAPPIKPEIREALGL